MDGWKGVICEQMNPCTILHYIDLHFGCKTQARERSRERTRREERGWREVAREGRRARKAPRRSQPPDARQEHNEAPIDQSEINKAKQLATTVAQDLQVHSCATVSEHADETASVSASASSAPKSNAGKGKGGKGKGAAGSNTFKGPASSTSPKKPLLKSRS